MWVPIAGGIVGGFGFQAWNLAARRCSGETVDGITVALLHQGIRHSSFLLSKTEILWNGF